MEQLIAAFEALWVKIVAFFPSLLAAVIIFVLALIVTKLTELSLIHISEPTRH